MTGMVRGAVYYLRRARIALPWCLGIGELNSAQRPTSTILARPSVLGLAVLAASPGFHGCGGGPDNLPLLDSQGQRVSFGTDLVDDVCQGTVAKLDRGVEQIEAALDL